LQFPPPPPPDLSCQFVIFFLNPFFVGIFFLQTHFLGQAHFLLPVTKGLCYKTFFWG
jgi:hypothetical protein